MTQMASASHQITGAQFGEVSTFSSQAISAISKVLEMR